MCRRLGIWAASALAGTSGHSGSGLVFAGREIVALKSVSTGTAIREPRPHCDTTRANAGKDAPTSIRIVFVWCVKPALPQTWIMEVNFVVHRRKPWTGKRHL